MSALADNKKYYWLKLKRDFFKRHDIRIIEEMPNGKDYILFYLKMLLESIDHEGELRFSDAIPYNENMLAVITNTNIDIVKAAMKIFVELKMIEILDDCTIYMGEVQRLIGSETGSAGRVRRHRQNQKALQCNTNETKCNTEIEKDKEKETDIYIEKKKDYQLIADSYNAICVSLPSIKKLSQSRIEQLDILLNTYSLEEFTMLFEKVEASDFLKGENDTHWTANFDWLIKGKNMAKVLNGNYDNKKTKKKIGFSYQPQADYEAIERMTRSKQNKPVTVANDKALKDRVEALRQKLQA